MNIFPLTLTVKIFLLLFLFSSWFLSLTTLTEAAVNEPTCSLYYLYNGKVGETKSQTTIQVVKNDFVGLLWNGVDAITAVDIDNNNVKPLGAQIVVPTKDVNYSYTFSQGSKNVTCSIKIEIVSGSLSIKNTAKSGEKITLSGRAVGTPKVILSVYEAGALKPTYVTKSLSVRSDKFTFKMPKSLSDGNYRIELQTPGSNALVLASSTITIGKVKPAPPTTLVIQKIPLLAGGTVKAGRGVAVAYLQVINIGNNPADLTGFKFEQIGTAPVSAITEVSVTDELGVAHGSVGNALSGTPFIRKAVDVPVVTTLAPKESRLFTVRVVVANTATVNVGQTISLTLTGLMSDSAIQSPLPVYGVTWAIGL